MFYEILLHFNVYSLTEFGKMNISCVNRVIDLKLDSNNPYKMLEKSSDWSILHDATTSYAKTLNAVFIRRVQDNDMSIPKVTRLQSLNFWSTIAYCCSVFDLYRISLSFTLIVSLAH